MPSGTRLAGGEALPVDGGTLQSAERLEGVVGNDAGFYEAELLVQRARAVLRAGVQRKKGTTAFASDPLGLDHQRAGNTASAIPDARHHLGDLATVRLIGRTVQVQCDSGHQ